ncbi:hypothetical protein GTA62_19685 [Roseobacter sp. HKCCD9010]|uniref:hypothetical protein n=1 Tax=unclassified Roseobacter TaxID=196798 RepID=UPI001492F87F|nr:MULTISPECIES: hypothetical protein [unclassified Roseobacter]MBF9052186.1 hypothetical protein [Rhodobacterales bacterium HKCCD4356]NNV14141.1 hypothetical protein [Roseobacter sp. HKCCD7357]NNV18365.1 hypothetical protein [Roseobacter sp. HKCCD8768]NNV27805.1 hypothetical protein [Roseobacter sp. HKCCD8192]NNV32091.1 hypothetical protein [Roseobacter sp. HKCCD9061]
MKTRDIKIIRDRLFARLHEVSGKRVSYHHRVSTHIGKGRQTLIGFLDEINSSEGFKEDGLTLVPGEVPWKPNVEVLLGAIYDDYLSRGWRLVYA